MIGRLRDDRLWIYGTDSSGGWKGIVDSAVKRSPLKIWRGGSANGPSDYASFNAARIPAIEFFTGMHGDVHQPTDTADKINVAGAVKVLAVAFDVLRGAAYSTRAMEYDASSRRSAVLGVTPDMVGSGKGLVLSRVLPGGPADRAGLKDGDTILKWDGQPMDNGEQLLAELQKHQPGDKVRLQVRRDDKTLDITVTLGGR